MSASQLRPCRTWFTTIRLSSPLFRSSYRYSHGATLGEVYASYQKVDEHLRRLRPDLITDAAKIEELQAKGELTPTMAAHFKKEIAASNEAKSIDACEPSSLCIESAEYWRKVLWYIGVPLTILVSINTYFLEMEHSAHLKEHPREVPAYPHLRVRNKVYLLVANYVIMVEILLGRRRSHPIPQSRG